MSSKKLYLWGGTALTMDAQGQVVEDAVIEVSEGRIQSVKSQKDFTLPPGAKGIDARGCLLTPGFVNAHTHTGMSLLRGVADDLPLHRWLNDAIFPLERQWGSEPFVYFGTRLAIAELIRSGTTLFNDMYYFEEHAAKAVHETGIRAICGQTLVEISGVEKDIENVFKKFDEYLDKVSQYPLVTPAIAPHSIYGVSDRGWREVIRYAEKRDLMVHLHLAETQQEEDDCLKTKGVTPTEYFESIGLWERKVVAAHATCVTEKEIEILGKHHVGIAHNPESNLKLGTKICPVVDLRRSGARVALGTDGVASNNNLDLLQEADFAAKLQTLRYAPGVFRAEDAVRLLTSEGAMAVGMGHLVGTLEAGKAADVIAIDIKKVHAVPMYHYYGHLIYSAVGSDVKHSVVNGNVLMENYELKTLDEAALIEEAVTWGKKIAAKGLLKKT